RFKRKRDFCSAQRDGKEGKARRQSTEFLKTVNRTLKVSDGHISALNDFRLPVSLSKNRDFMRFPFLFALLFIFASAGAQAPQPIIAFPFQLELFTPDSLPTTSAAVLGQGKITVLAFWLSTCLPCQLELAAYTSKYAEWQKQADFQLVAISIDYPQRFQQMARMAHSSGWPFPTYWDSTQSFRNILPGGLNGLPQVFLFDKKGELVWQHKRYASGDEEELLAQILTLQHKAP
ncbi:MAG: TlpA disulfide reductase family protein, partial [Saprospiraceae bacterium]